MHTRTHLSRETSRKNIFYFLDRFFSHSCDHFSRHFMQIANQQQPDVVSGRLNAFFLAEKSMTLPNGNARVANKVLSFASLNATLTSSAGKLFRKRERFTRSAAVFEL